MYFDVAMPLTLFVVVAVAMLLEGRAEKKLKVSFEEREFSVRDTVLLIAAIGAIVSLIVFIPQMAIMLLYLIGYSLLLFVFTYIFSDTEKRGAKMFCWAFLIISFVVATVSLVSFGAKTVVAYGALAFYCLFGFTILALLYEEIRAGTGGRWYLAVLPPASFLCLYVFFRETPIWFPYMLDLYGSVFAVLIVLYMGSLFTWKTSLVFVGLITILDTILVLVTGSMISAARHVTVLSLPVSISLPTLPPIVTEWGIIYMSLGLGDFFFAGLIGVQTLKRFGKRFAVLSIIVMSTSFFIFETAMLNYSLIALPGTLMIICGWLLLVLWRENTTLFYVSLMVFSFLLATFGLISFGTNAFASRLTNSTVAYATLSLYFLFSIMFIAFMKRKTSRTSMTEGNTRKKKHPVQKGE